MISKDKIQILHQKVEIKGTCNEKFLPVREAFKFNLDTGQDIGASVCIYIDGEKAVDLWGGYFDGTYTRSFEADSIVQCYSSTKTITALCALVLADQGGFNLDDKVTKYWPEFGAEGKEEILIRQFLGHTSGLCGWIVPMTFYDLYDNEKSVDLLARQAPLWKPGRTSGYHGYTQGHLVGEIIRRITGKSLGTFLAEDVAGPVGAADDFYIGTPERSDPRVSLLIQGAPQDHPLGQKYHDIALYNPHPTPQDTWTIEWRRAELGAMNGHGCARGIAALQSILASGSANGKKMMSDSTRKRVLELQSDGADLVIGYPCKWGMGYSLEQGLFPGVPADANIAWWAGNGGSMSFVDLDKRMSIGFVPNRWISGPFEIFRSVNIIKAAYDSFSK